jgi:hypothetical protein
MSKIALAIIIGLILLIGIPVLLFFIIRYLIRYNAQLKRENTQPKDEIVKMNIDDL